jgi:hypothetical protein
VTPYAFVEHATTITAIPLAIIGFGFTLWQVRKTRKAAEAARDAAGLAQRGIGRGNLLVLIPQLQRVEDELERAIHSGHQELALTWIGTWRWQAGQLRGLIQVTAPTNRKMLKAIQTSMVAASDAKASLVSEKTIDLAAETKGVMSAIAAVTVDLGEIAVIQGMRVGGIEND